ncbi:MFS transporter [Actinomadura sp. NAK00032]|uniref:MFS transporter n=1 Tax=Actinomadura sp. NAK00032 TaxID=2742128 RepID=UPI00159265EC|nr:MFS transporter [Actinomadura sp. NAK00032]QKW35554.1 MFS transporter [Actinomadura sp. NAK00032]
MPGTRSSRPAALLIAVLVLAETVSAFETTMSVQLLYAQLPFFGTDISKLTWIVTAYMLVAAAATGVCGRLGDQFGRTRVLNIVLLVSAVGSIVSAVAPDLDVLIVGRGMQGVSGAVLPLVIGLARETLPREKVTTGIAVVSASALIAGASGMLVAGFILDHLDWRLIFWSAVLLAALAMAGIRAVVPKSAAATRDPGKVDYLGAVLFSVAVGTTLYGVTKSSEWTWNDSRTLGFLGAGFVLLALWTVWELRVRHPMMEVRRFANPKFAIGMLATVIIAFGVFGLSQVMPTAVLRTPTHLPVPGGDPIDLPVGLGLTATMTGLVGGLGALVGFAISPLPGRISRRHGAARTIMIGSAVAVGAFWSVVHLHTTLGGFIAFTIVSSVAVTFCYGALPTLIVECVPPEETSAAVGMQAVVRTTFQGVAASFSGVFLARGEIKVGDLAFLSEKGLGTLAVAAVVAAVLGFLLAVAASRYRESMLAGGDGAAARAGREPAVRLD